MSTPTSETLNGGSTLAPSQNSDANKSSEGVKLPGATGTDSINSGMNVSTQVPSPVAKPVDFKAITGSYAGDHRSNPGDVAAASVATAADNGGPRNRVGQFDKPSTGAPEKFGSGSGESEGAGA